MIRPLIRRELRSLRWVLSAGLILTLLLAGIAAGTYPYLNRVLGSLPEEVLESLAGLEIARDLLAMTSDYSYYLWTQWNAKNLVQTGSLFALLLAVLQFSAEASRGTMGFLLTRPVSRRQVFTAKLITGAVVLLLLSAGGSLILLLASLVAGNPVDGGLTLVISSLISWVWLVLFYLICTGICLTGHDPVRSGALSAAAGLILSLPVHIAPVRFLSIFWHMRAAGWYLEGDAPIISLCAAVLFISLTALISFRRFAGNAYE
jgi:ABC-type transport system involved in multi-copper enzyme maturation permease subunit